jgi:hypothetical protein
VSGLSGAPTSSCSTSVVTSTFCAFGAEPLSTIEELRERARFIFNVLLPESYEVLSDEEKMRQGRTWGSLNQSGCGAAFRVPVS